MITIRQSVRPDTKIQIPDILNAGLLWMKNKYPLVDFDKVDYIFSSGFNRSRYFRNEAANAKYINPNVCVSTRATLMLYNKPSLGMKKNKLFVGSNIQMICAIIHELTHHVQYEQKHRQGNELDTTKNELEYLKEFHPTFYKKLCE